MTITKPPETISFKTFDGLTLRGHLYRASQKGPAIILTPGFNGVKEMLTRQIAATYQKNNITALAYDPRNLGESDGLPRNENNPTTMLRDYSSALTYLSTLDVVESQQIGFWGLSFNGPVALAAAGWDRRARFVIAACPCMDYFAKDRIPSLYEDATEDRVSRVEGNEPKMVKVWTREGSPVFDVPESEGPKAYSMAMKAINAGLRYKNEVTVETLANLAAWDPGALIESLDRTSVLFLVPGMDGIAPPERQLRLFDRLRCPKELHVAEGKGHFDLLAGEGREKRQRLQVEFIRGVCGEGVRAML